MKNKLLFQVVTCLTLSALPHIVFAQAPDLGTAAGFVLFSSNGAVGNTGISHLTGHVGTNNGASTAFGNVNGVMHDNDGVSAAASTDLLAAYNDLNSTTPAFFPAPLLGNGTTLNAGVYSIAGNTTLTGTLNLDAQNNPNAVFIFQIQGTLSTAAFSEIQLQNGALACNVFWKVEGLVSMATGTKMKGTLIANNAGIDMSSGAELEGRALSTTGAVSVDGVLAYTPTGCGSPVLTGPAAPALASVACLAIFSSDGDVTNSGISFITGDVGTNTGLTTGFDSSTVNGTVHPIQDGFTASAASDLLVVYNYLSTLTEDIELLYPAEFGNSLVLTPHTYLLDAATVFTDTLFLNAEGNANAVFVVVINGALSTSTYATVQLINGATPENVFWLVEGAVDINDYSTFTGTIVSNNGAINLLTGASIEGRALTTTGAVSTKAVNVVATSIPANCGTVGITQTSANVLHCSVYPNPFSTSMTVELLNASHTGGQLFSIFNAMGSLVAREVLNQPNTTIHANLPSGVYFYQVSDASGIVQSGTLIRQ